MRGEEEYEATISAIQESIVAISGSNVLADGKKRELFARLRYLVGVPLLCRGGGTKSK